MADDGCKIPAIPCILAAFDCAVTAADTDVGCKPIPELR